MSASTCLLIVLCAMLCWLRTAPLSAQDSLPCASPSECEQAAAVLADRARERFAEGDLEAAVVLLREAIYLHETPALRHNLARALAELGRWEEARAEYRNCLRLELDDDARARIQAEVARLSAVIRAAHGEGEAAPISAPTTSPVSAPRRPEPALAPGTTSDPAPWVFAGGGVVVLGAAVALAVAFEDTVGQVRRAPSLEAALPLADRAEGLAIGADIGFALGGTLALIGVIWGIITLASASSPVAQALRPSGGELRAVF
ncbi:MAG: tetratricopeptide repeat protein [Myxococcota bacterium]|nr:tetratricopeptide repeat protein [Myxococcota bacterium]